MQTVLKMKHRFGEGTGAIPGVGLSCEPSVSASPTQLFVLGYRLTSSIGKRLKSIREPRKWNKKPKTEHEKRN
jgi:hypothetical protein